MNRSNVARIVILIGAGALLVVMLFEVSFDPQCELPSDGKITDPVQEARYVQCYSRHDADIHERAFATIDNPDVQREFITAERERARIACRAVFPERVAAERTPSRCSLINLRFRY